MGVLDLLPTALLALLGVDSVFFPKQMTIVDNATYDYIIVGAGTAGCVLTKRLIDANFTVLLLESGDDPAVNSIKPALFYSLPQTSIDYNYKSTYDDYAAMGQGNYTRLTAGKMLGGSSSLNHLLHLRGPSCSYDNWAEKTGDDSWSYDNLLPYFIKSENVTDDEIYAAYPNAHGTDGPVGLSRQTHANTDDYLAAFAEVGIPTVLDLNANGNSSGSTQPLLTIKNGIRQSTALTYLYSVKGNSNLYVSKNTIVSKVIIENNVAVGVQAIYEDTTYTFRARKEVILSAGVFNTPQVLMLSGIGPKEHLDSLNISVIADLPVGENLITPPTVVMVHKTKQYVELVSTLFSLTTLLDFSELPFSLFVGSASTNKSNTCPNYQTYNLILPHDSPLLSLACTLIYGYESSICLDWQKQVILRDSLYSVLVDVDVKSRGSVQLNSTDPKDSPKITTGFYTNKEDLTTMIAIIRDFNKIVNSTLFQEYGAEKVGLNFTECADKEADSDEFWECYILRRTISQYIYTSSCAMGSVVDTKLKVKGIDNLRAVDASTFYDLPRSATNAAVLALAEKAADIIINGEA